MSKVTQARFHWTPKSVLPIRDFLRSNKPSIITNDMTDWIMVQGGGDLPRADPERESSYPDVLAAAIRIMNDLTNQLKAIEKDNDIPVRAKKGVKSKKVIREETCNEVTAALKTLCVESRWTGGKWLLFPSHAEVDTTWNEIAQSVASGPLNQAGVFLAKVATTPASFSEGDEPGTHLICLHMENIYDITVVRKVLETLLTCHGIEPSAAKSDLYTLAGIDSNHPSRLRSSIWRPSEVIEGGAEAIKALKLQHTKKVNSSAGNGRTSNVDRDGFINSDSEDERMMASVAKRKAESAAPVQKITIDNWVKSGSKSPVKPPAAKRPRNPAIIHKENDIFESPSDSD